MGRKGLSRFWSDIPSINADSELTAYRDRQWSRQIQPNDVRDLAQLAIAVPYCDAVVVEKFWKRDLYIAKWDGSDSHKLVSGKGVMLGRVFHPMAEDWFTGVLTTANA